MGCGVYWNQVREIERALGTMRRFGISEGADAYQSLFKIRGRLMAQVGFKFPRVVSLVASIIGASPGIFRVWHDIESGWMVEARARPGAPPIYRMVSDEVAMMVVKRELTPEAEEELLTPVEYYGE